MNLEINLKRPRGSFQLFGTGPKTDVIHNTITRKGMDLFSKSTHPSPLIDANGGKIKYAMLGTGSTDIDRDSESIEGDVYVSNDLTASITYTTEDDLRYANINLQFTFPEAEEDLEFSQVGLFGSSTNEDMLFGQTLDNNIYYEKGEVPKLLYTIKVNIISSMTKAYSGTISDATYDAYVQFHEEGSDTLRLLWPYDSGGNVLYSGYAARPILNNSALANGMARYSNLVEVDEDYTSTTHNIEYIILGTEAGDVEFFLIECGNYSNTQSGYSIRIQFGRDIYKSIEHILKMKFRVRINWS